MSINYTMVAVIMLFVILISIQFTLNKNIKDENNERIRKY